MNRSTVCHKAQYGGVRSKPKFYLPSLKIEQGEFQQDWVITDGDTYTEKLFMESITLRCLQETFTFIR